MIGGARDWMMAMVGDAAVKGLGTSGGKGWRLVYDCAKTGWGLV